MPTLQDRLTEFAKQTSPQQDVGEKLREAFAQPQPEVRERDTAVERAGTTRVEEPEAPEAPDPVEARLRDFARETSPQDDLLLDPSSLMAEPELSPEVPSTTAVQEAQKMLPTRLDPYTDPELDDETRARLDVDKALEMSRIPFTGMPEPRNRLANYRNVFAQGLGDIATGMGPFISGAWRALMQDLTRGHGEGLLYPAKVEDDFFFRAGKALEGQLEEVFPENPEYQREFMTKLARGAGTLTGQIGATMATGGGALASTGIMASSFSGMEYRRALEATGSEEKAFQTMLLNLPINAPQAWPVLRSVRIMETATKGGIKNYLKSAGASSLREGIVEAMQTFGQNIVASKMYDEARDIGAGVLEGGLIGVVLGMGMGGMALGLRRRSNDPTKSLDERIEAEESARVIDRYIKESGEATGIYSQVGAAAKGARVGRSYNRAKAQEFEAETRYKPEDFNLDPKVPNDPRGTLALTPATIEHRSRVMKTYKKYLMEFGDFPRDMRTDILGSKDVRFGMSMKIVELSRDAEAALRAEYNISRFSNPFTSSKVPDQVLNDINKYFDTGEGLSNVPARLRQPVREMRLHVDRLAESGLQMGVWEGAMKARVAKNKGSYMYRTYKKHIYGDKWRKKVPKQVRNSAKSWIDQQFREQGLVRSDKQVEELVRKLLLVDDSPIAILGKDFSLQKRVSDLKRRSQLKIGSKEFDEIPKPIRDLWGEIDSPFVRYVQSAQKLSNLLSSHALLKKLRTQYEGKYFFDPKKTPPEVFSRLDLVPTGEVRATPVGLQTDAQMPRTQELMEFVQFSPGGDIRTSPLDGMWTTPEIKSAFQKATSAAVRHGHIVNSFIKMNAVAKIGATSLSPRTFVRNYIGTAIFYPAQGHFAPAEVKATWDVAMAAFRNPKSHRAEWEKWARLGITERSPRAGEIRDLMADVDPTFSELNMLDVVGGRFSRITKKGVKTLSNLYAFWDTFTRVMLFNAEKRKYNKYAPDLKVTDEQIAEIVKNNYQDYSRASVGVRNLRRNFAIGPFITFHSEVVRTSVNTVRQAKHEIASNHKGVRRIGYERMASFITFAALGSFAVGKTMQYVLGWTNDFMDAVRDFSAPWNEKATLMPIDRYRGGARYLNLTYTDPYEIIREPVLQLFRDGDETSFYKSLYESGKTFIQPAITPELYTKAVAEAAMNRRSIDDPRSGRVFNPEDQLHVQTMDRLAHIWDGIEPGFLKQGSEIFEAIGPEPDRTMAESVSALFGQRIVRVEPKKDLPFKARAYNGTLRDLRGTFGRYARGEEADPVKRTRAFTRANKIKKEEFDKMQRYVESAFKMGLSWTETREALMEGGMSGAEADRIWKGEFEPFEMNYLED